MFCVHDRAFRNGGEIVAIEIDIEYADRNFESFQAFNLCRESLRQRNAAALDPDESQLIEIGGFLEHFMRETDQCAVDLGGAHELLLFANGGHEVRVVLRGSCHASD